MSSSIGGFTSILPGTRVRTGEGVIGTVERLEGPDGGQPDHMIVRSDDGAWRYRIPLMLVSSVAQETFHPMVQVNVAPDDLKNYILESITDGREVVPPAVAGGQWAPDDPQAVLRIPLVTEELVPQKHSVVRGKIHIHKGVEMLNQNLTVPVYHEEAVVEHIPVDQYDPHAPTNPNETIIPVVEEQLVVEKKTVIKEYIRVRKNLVTQQQDVHEVVRREFVEVTEQRDAAASGDAPLLRVVQPSGDGGGAASQ